MCRNFGVFAVLAVAAGAGVALRPGPSAAQGAPAPPPVAAPPAPAPPPVGAPPASAPPPAPAPAPPPDPGDVAAGRDLFQPGCSSCHGADGHGTANGPSLEHSGAAAADFYLTTGRMPLDDPKAQAVRKKPAYPPGQIRLLVAYVASLGDGPAIPTVGRGKLSAGYLQFSINCASCHSAIGAGGALGYGDEVPSLIHASATQIEEAARIGPGPMPVFGPDTLSQSQLDDVAKYVHYLQHPHDRGGFGLGHLGPIPEGFMGWVAGLGLLLVLTRLIGTRA